MNFNDNSEMGIMRLSDNLKTSDSVDWYQSLSCTSYAACKITALIESTQNTDFLYAASLVQDSGADKTYGQLHHFDSSGRYYWTMEYEQGDASMTNWYAGVRMVTLNSAGRLVIIQNLESSSGPIQITNFKTISNSNHNSVPSTSNVHTYQFESSN